ncbi:MAG: K(+)/H(+) antiporter NhaP2 [Syntrophorhabdus sp. PtaB.Bin006]|nr:MAG: K(+)/H(+) antiporter NhaP2 [Syntrophorhabdus sp. PtaB.Bin006]
MILATIFVLLIFFYSLVSRQLGRTIITGPVVFTMAGILVSIFLPSSLELEGNQKVLLFIAEMGLVLLLFTDASRIKLKDVRSLRRLPARLLSIGMLLTIFLGAVAARVVFPHLSIWEVGILAAILAPTDAGLGQVIVSSPRVPIRIRNALNVEAGLNDGMSVPFLMFFIAMAQPGSGGSSVLTRFLVEQLGFGVLIGIGIGLLGGWLLGWAHRKQWMAESLEQLGLVSLPILAMIFSEPSGASMFIVAFVAGMTSQVGFEAVGGRSVEFTEGWGQLFNFFVFFFLGLMVPGGWHLLSSDLVIYAILSLTLIRMVPVAVALIGTRLKRSTVLFMGWFGPRGLASIVLGLVYIEQEAHLPGEPTIRLAVTITVLLSVCAHGLSALPGIGLYAKSISTLAEDTPELKGSNLE